MNALLRSHVPTFQPANPPNVSLALVGPRPLLMQYLDRYTPEQGRRHEVLPGITGWVQACPERGRRVNGRNALTWGKKFELDVWYKPGDRGRH